MAIIVLLDIRADRQAGPGSGMLGVVAVRAAGANLDVPEGLLPTTLCGRGTAPGQPWYPPEFADVRCGGVRAGAAWPVGRVVAVSETARVLRRATGVLEQRALAADEPGAQWMVDQDEHGALVLASHRLGEGDAVAGGPIGTSTVAVFAYADHPEWHAPARALAAAAHCAGLDPDTSLALAAWLRTGRRRAPRPGGRCRQGVPARAVTATRLSLAQSHRSGSGGGAVRSGPDLSTAITLAPLAAGVPPHLRSSRPPRWRPDNLP
ncbi:hypothetical protein ACWDCZ_28220, partial [Kitasatospora sp. NPDC001225]